MDYKILGIFILLTILVSIQYSLNRVLMELKEIKKIILQNKIRS